VGEKVEPNPVNSPENVPDRHSQPKSGQTVSRRGFLVGAGTGVAATAVAAAGATVQKPPPAAKAQQDQAGRSPASTAPSTALPASMRRVRLNINGIDHDLTVDVRENLWETMTYKLGLSGSTLGCDRAQCGACTVLLDGRPVNSCAVLSARLGRGQKILTADGIVTGAGIAGLHPIQRAFWKEGGFQCGICTRGFIMSTYALLQDNKSPSRDQIREALAGNICRCGEYAKIYDSVEKAAAEMRKA